MGLTVENIFEKLHQNIIKEMRSIEDINIETKLNFLHDSLEIVELIMFAEEEFEISIDLYNASRFETFKGLCNEIFMQIIRKQGV